MHTIRIPHNYPRPKFDFGQPVLFKDGIEGLILGQVTGIIWSHVDETWQYRIKEFVYDRDYEFTTPEEIDIVDLEKIFEKCLEENYAEVEDTLGTESL